MFGYFCDIDQVSVGFGKGGTGQLHMTLEVLATLSRQFDET